MWCNKCLAATAVHSEQTRRLSTEIRGSLFRILRGPSSEKDVVWWNTYKLVSSIKSDAQAEFNAYFREKGWTVETIQRVLTLFHGQDLANNGVAGGIFRWWVSTIPETT
eukprot:1241989-Rhodomonas_salina.1